MIVALCIKATDKSLLLVVGMFSNLFKYQLQANQLRVIDRERPSCVIGSCFMYHMDWRAE